jgi:hypothetical protein
MDELIVRRGEFEARHARLIFKDGTLSTLIDFQMGARKMPTRGACNHFAQRFHGTRDLNDRCSRADSALGAG